MWGAQIFIIVLSSSWINPFIIMQYPFLSFVTVFILKSSFVWYEHGYYSFLLISICLEYLYPSPQCQSVCVCKSEVGLYRQPVCGSCFHIHLTKLCLLVWEFSPFTFKVIINMYIYITIYLYWVFFFFCRSFSSSPLVFST